MDSRHICVYMVYTELVLALRLEESLLPLPSWIFTIKVLLVKYDLSRQ